MEQFQYTKEDLEKRLDIATSKNEKISKCLEYAIDRLVEYHNQAGKGLIVDDAFYDLYSKMQKTMELYKNYNDRITKKITAKLEDMKSVETEKPSRIPRRSI